MVALWTAIIEGLIAFKDFAMKTKIFDRRKGKHEKGNRMVLFGKYIQKIKDQGRQIKFLAKEVRKIPGLERQLTACKVERATCNAQYRQIFNINKDLSKRVASLERRIA